MPRVRAAVFDAYGTLLDVHAAVARHAARLYDLPVPPELRLPEADQTATGPRDPAAADLTTV